jgi:hypothetical protein
MKNMIFKNITTGELVTVSDVRPSPDFEGEEVQYRRHNAVVVIAGSKARRMYHFIKPRYQFLQTYRRVEQNTI